MKKYRVIIPGNVRPVPERFELSAASLLLEYFEADIEFLPVTSDRTPDIKVGNKKWEIKSPLGKSQHTIETQLKRASKQAAYVVIDARRCKIHIARIRNQLKYHGAIKKHIKRIVLITKDGRVEDIK